MRISVMNSGRAKKIYLVDSYRDVNNKVQTKVIECFGSFDELSKIYPDPVAHFKKIAKEKTLDNASVRKNTIEVSFHTGIKKDDESKLSNIGYLFLQKICSSLDIKGICDEIASKYKFEYDLNSILSNLIYARTLAPASKLSSFEYAKTLLEKPNFQLQDIYRALDVIEENSDFIQSQLYKNSTKIIKRNTKVLYYDCTNYFFEIEDEDELRQYGVSKEHRPNPIVQMGLFMDGDGIPLAFNINPGATNEQTTLLPIERTIVKDFGLSKFIVCTDAGLSSYTNRYLNNFRNKAFISAYSIKKLPAHLQDWVFNSKDWSSNGLSGDSEILFKSRVVEESGIINFGNGKEKVKIDQRIIVSFSKKYATYQKTIRDHQIERALALIKSPGKFNRTNVNDCKRFINNVKVTQDGELASTQDLSLNIDAINNESKYDGLYCVITNLEDEDSKIIQINKNRWEIEESFRIMKTEFKARPVYLSNHNRIKAHFMTCFMALLVYRLLEKQLNSNFTTSEILDTLKNMKMFKLEDKGYAPTYEITDLTKKLEENFSMVTSFEAYSNAGVKKLIKTSKS